MLVCPQPFRVLVLVHLPLSFPSHRVAVKRLISARGCIYFSPGNLQPGHLANGLGPAGRACHVYDRASSRPPSAQSSPRNVERCRPRPPNLPSQPGIVESRKRLRGCDEEGRGGVCRRGRRGIRRRRTPGRGIGAHQPCQACQCSMPWAISAGSIRTSLQDACRGLHFGFWSRNKLFDGS